MRAALLPFFAIALACPALGQSFEQRGFLEFQGFGFPQTAPNDSSNVVGNALLRWDASMRPASWLKLNASFDARIDTHQQVLRDAVVSLDDRELQRPPMTLRQFNIELHKGYFTLVAGRQLIRWGRTDILTPTDHFAPRDYVGGFIDNDFLAVNAVRATLASSHDTLDAIWQPLFTPSRTPLLNQRWSVLPTQMNGIAMIDGGSRFPGGSQFGIRWSHTQGPAEFAVSYFRGFNSLTLFQTQPGPGVPPANITIQRTYPQLTSYGADFSYQFPWVAVKAESAYFTTNTPGAPDYLLYVVQLERQVGELSLVGGYAGSNITHGPRDALQFAPDRGLARSFVGRAGYTIDVNRSFSVEAAVRSGGSFVRAQYSQSFGTHWRLTPGVAWLRGDAADFIGQFHRNSYLFLVLRYSF